MAKSPDYFTRRFEKIFLW